MTSKIPLLIITTILSTNTLFGYQLKNKIRLMGPACSIDTKLIETTEVLKVNYPHKEPDYSMDLIKSFNQGNLTIDKDAIVYEKDNNGIKTLELKKRGE